MFKGFCQLSAPYFGSPAGRKGRLCAVIIIGMGLLGLFTSYTHNVWQKAWWDLFSHRNKHKFPHLIFIFILLAIAGMLINVYKDYIRAWLYIDWREFMTERLTQRWLASHTHFLLQLGEGHSAANAGAGGGSGGTGLSAPTARDGGVGAAGGGGGSGEGGVDNPEQRIQEDIHLFTESSLEIIPDCLSALGNLIVFTPIVLYMEPKKAFNLFELRGWLLYAAMLYSTAGALATHFIGWPLSRFSFARQRYEADFRHLALHVREHGESVALYGSEAREERSLRDRFARIKLVQWQQMILAKQLNFFTSTYGFIQFLVPFFILAPNYFNKDISLGDLFQLTGAIGNMAGALDWFMRIYEPLARWRATTDRLLEFEAAIDVIQGLAHSASSGVKFGGPPRDGGSGRDALLAKMRRGSEPSPSASSSGVGPPPLLPKEENEEEGDDAKDAQLGSTTTGEDGLQAIIAVVRLPSGEPIWQDLRVQVVQGARVLISGPDGVGKSLLFKALAGLWPYVEGADIRLPAEDSNRVLFVPQRPALPQTCSLAEALAYPEQRESYGEAELLSALQDVRLEELVRPGPASEREEPAPAAAGSADMDTAGLQQGLENVDNWSARLSPGMQQRLALAHVILRQPRVLFLDEATSGCSSQAATELYNKVMERLPEGSMIISISHDEATLAPLHDVHISITVDEEVPGHKKLCLLKGKGLALASARGPCGER
jgi:putative ATP-binding cassette transporter